MALYIAHVHPFCATSSSYYCHILSPWANSLSSMLLLFSSVTYMLQSNPMHFSTSLPTVRFLAFPTSLPLRLDHGTWWPPATNLRDRWHPFFLSPNKYPMHLHSSCLFFFVVCVAVSYQTLTPFLTSALFSTPSFFSSLSNTINTISLYPPIHQRSQNNNIITCPRRGNPKNR